MSSLAKTLNFALVAAGFHGSLLVAQTFLEDAQGYTTHCSLPGREDEVSLQDVWYGFTPGESLVCVPGRLEYIRGGDITGCVSVIIELDSLGRDQKTLAKGEALLFAYHRGHLVEVLKADFWTEEAHKCVFYRGFLEEAYPRGRVMPRNIPYGLLAIRANTDWRYEICYFAWLQCLLFITFAEHFQAACTHSATQHGAKEITGSLPSEILGEAAWRTAHRSSVRPQTVHPCDGEWYEFQNRFSGLDLRAELKKFQIFVKSFTGKPLLLWVSDEDTGESLKNMVVKIEGYPLSSFYLLHEGKVLHEGDRMRDCQIGQNSTLYVMHRMRGGMPARTAGPSSYKDAARSKGPQTYKDAARSKGPQTEASTNVQPSPYIVEKLDSTPVLEIKNQQVKGLFNTLQNQAVICRFNGFWPRSHDLHAWIYQNWTANCQLLLCSKGFFVVQFESMDDYQKVFLQGPWFWGRAGLFITPWFPEFDANTMVVTKMPVWVRLPNLPLPYWHHEVLEDIGNLLGSFIKSDKERQDKGLFTYARICVEIDLSKGLPDRMHLKHESHIWLQRLDYENTAFRCRYCQLTGHLQDTCPFAKKLPKKKKGMRTNRKNWQADYVPSSDEEEASEEEEQQEVPREEETMVSDDGEAQTTGNQTTGEDIQINMENRVDALASSKKHKEDSLSDKGIQTAIVIHEEAPISGIKRGHESEKSDSDKEHPAKQKPEMVNGRQVVVATSSQGRWVEVKNKRKGKKGKIEAFFQP